MKHMWGNISFGFLLEHRSQYLIDGLSFCDTFHLWHKYFHDPAFIFCSGCLNGKICQNCFYNLDGSGGGSVQNGSGVCSACNGTRTCHVCYGNTYTYIPSYTDTAGTYVYCSSCNGTNICEFCGGTGRE